VQCGVQTIGRRNELTQAIEQSRARRADRRIRDANSETASPPRFDRCLTLDDFFLMSIFHPTLTHALRIESDLAVGHRPPASTTLTRLRQVAHHIAIPRNSFSKRRRKAIGDSRDESDRKICRWHLERRRLLEVSGLFEGVGTCWFGCGKGRGGRPAAFCRITSHKSTVLAGVNGMANRVP